LVDNGEVPLEQGFRYTHKDWRLAMLFRNLLGLTVDRKDYREAFGLDVYEEYMTIWDALGERDLVEVTPERIALIGDGLFYTPMIQALLAEERYQSLREREIAALAAGRFEPLSLDVPRLLTTTANRTVGE